jgi:ubiquinone biosynthesis protein
MVQKILVGTDTSASADLAVAQAADLARAYHAELLVLYVKPSLEAREVADPKKAPDPAGYLERIRQRFPDLTLRTRSAPGDPAETICDVAQEEGVDAIVVGNRGIHGRKRRFLGSVPSGVVRRSPCSVFIVDTRIAQ